MKKLLFIVLACISASICDAQDNGPKKQFVKHTTVYENFKPAIIKTTDGKTVNMKQANIFMKNSKLLYKSNGQNKQANINTIESVDFGDRQYVRADSLLAYVVDSADDNLLLCATLIDIEAMKNIMDNERLITSLEIKDNDYINVTTSEKKAIEDIEYPVVNVYYFRVGNKTIKAHERNVKQVISKDKRRMLTSEMSAPGFSWSDEQSMKNVLKLLQR